VAVWVTTSYPPTTFETLNNSVRKYDSLRGKYLSAYVDCLRLCQSRNETETLLRWVISSQRDLPAWFQASAVAKGGKPEKPHTQDTLLVQNQSPTSFTFLTGLKRFVNSAMAQILKQELLDDEVPAGSIENHLKLAYACYLRMNCSVAELKKTHAWKYEPGGVSEVEALCLAFTKPNPINSRVLVDPNDWSGGGQKLVLLEAALKRCRELFPTTSGAFFSKKSLQKSKTQSKAERRGSINSTGQLAGTKRSFEVKVPEGLGVGETFTTTIMAGEAAKKVKLTVPSGEPDVLRFSVDESTEAMQN
jgi:hypothetical protein